MQGSPDKEDPGTHGGQAPRAGKPHLRIWVLSFRDGIRRGTGTVSLL